MTKDAKFRKLRPAQLAGVRGGVLEPALTTTSKQEAEGIKVYIDVVYNHTAEG